MPVELVLRGMENDGVIDLRTAFPQYRTRLTDDHAPKHSVEAYQFEIPCPHGAIYAYSDRLLAAWVGPDCPRVKAKILRLEGVEHLQVGDTEAVVTFDPKTPAGEAVFAFMRPRKKRKATGKPFGADNPPPRLVI